MRVLVPRCYVDGMQRTRTTRRLTRLFLSLLIGGLSGGVTAAWTRPDLGVTAGWLVAVLVYCLWTWALLWRLDPDETAAHARAEDPGRGVTDVVLLVAAIASVVGVGFVLAAGKAHDLLTAGLGAACVAASWLLVHTIYGVRYADLYFSSPRPPIDFGDDPPTYADFAYLTFCLGMTYQISDTNVRTRGMRTAVLWHTLLSYFMGAVVLACTINLVSGLAAA